MIYAIAVKMCWIIFSRHPAYLKQFLTGFAPYYLASICDLGRLRKNKYDKPVEAFKHRTFCMPGDRL
jgi:hypothetical protein